MTDTNMMGAFHFVSAVMNHNKVASAKNAALVEVERSLARDGDETYRRLRV
jgi:hypothetical protein